MKKSKRTREFYNLSNSFLVPLGEINLLFHKKLKIAFVLGQVIPLNDYIDDRELEKWLSYALKPILYLFYLTNNS